jgi:hypothetical protein
VVAQLEAFRTRIPGRLRDEPGQPIGGIASSRGLPVDIAQTLVKPMVGTTLETRRVRRGMRYYVAGEAPRKRGGCWELLGRRAARVLGSWEGWHRQRAAGADRRRASPSREYELATGTGKTA